MKIENIKNQCTGCSACKAVCPLNCIEMLADEEGFYFPVIDHEKCVKCGKCESVCQVFQSNHIKNEKTTYFGFHKDAQKRYDSSSGGAFVALAEETIKNGGVVFGAFFDLKERTLYHCSTDSVSLPELQKSKYIESDMRDTIAEIQKNIDQKRRVLFCGTPCQGAGVKKAISDAEGFLVVCDFICHGVPSSALFKEHLDSLMGKTELLELDFRPKDKGWSGMNVCFKTRTKTKAKAFLTPFMFDSFYRGFMSENVFLRRSCYDCRHRQEHLSDITIADFWGWREYDPNINDEKGLSLIVANNDLGRSLVESIQGEFNLTQIDNRYSEYAYGKKDYSKAWGKRDAFFELVREKGFEKAAKKTYMKGSLKQEIIYKLKKIVKKLLRMG